MKKVDKSSFAGTTAEQNTEVDVKHVSQPIAKPNVTRRFYCNCSKCDGKETVEVIEKKSKRFTELQVKKCTKCKHQWGIKHVLAVMYGG